jgi:hypothetical protein
MPLSGSVATLKTVTDDASEGSKVSGSQIDQPVNELILLANIIVADPAYLPLPNHVQRLLS